MKTLATLALALAAFEVSVDAFLTPRGLPNNPLARTPRPSKRSPKEKFNKKRAYTGPILPIENTTTITSPTGVRVTYKEAGDVCEKTPGVKTYTGFVELAQDMHAWFCMFLFLFSTVLDFALESCLSRLAKQGSLSPETTLHQTLSPSGSTEGPARTRRLDSLKVCL